jgi:hypothetical protein
MMVLWPPGVHAVLCQEIGRHSLVVEMTPFLFYTIGEALTSSFRWQIPGFTWRGLTTPCGSHETPRLGHAANVISICLLMLRLIS